VLRACFISPEGDKESAKIGTKLPWSGIEGRWRVGRELASSSFGYFQTNFGH